MLRKVSIIFLISLSIFACRNRGGSSTTKSVDGRPTASDRQAAEQIKSLVDQYYRDSNPTEKVETRKKFYDLAEGARASGNLKNVLRALLQVSGKVAKNSSFGEMTEDAREDLVAQLDAAIAGELVFRKEGSGYKSWNIVSSEMLSLVATTNFAPAGPGTPSHLKNEDYLTELSDVVKSSFHEFRNAKILVNGPASFSERERLIDNAKKRIWISSWSFYDDETGAAFAAKLISAAKRGVDVRIMVDGFTARQKFADETAATMQKGGVQVIPWMHRKQQFLGMHRKIMLVDTKSMIIGGMNFGNVYSHRANKDPKQHWRDTDLYAEGLVVLQAEKVFANAWNFAISSHPKPSGLKPIVGPGGAPPLSKGPRMAILDHEPVRGVGDPIYLVTLKAIQGATESIYIENAYYIATPAIELALVDAARRGVKVVVYTNSVDSVDVSTLIRPIYRGLPKLFKAGVEIYLQRGPTLHSKFMVVDRSFGWIGSYNLHPRSFRVESETVAAFSDRILGGNLAGVFERDIKAAEKVRSLAKIEIPKVFISDMAEAFFFDQL